MCLEKEKFIQTVGLLFSYARSLAFGIRNLLKKSTNENYGCSVSGLVYGCGGVDLWVFRTRIGVRERVREGFWVLGIEGWGGKRLWDKDLRMG